MLDFSHVYMYFLGQIDRDQICCDHYMRLYLSRLQHTGQAPVCNGSRDDADRAVPFPPCNSLAQVNPVDDELLFHNAHSLIFVVGQATISQPQLNYNADHPPVSADEIAGICSGKLVRREGRYFTRIKEKGQLEDVSSCPCRPR